MNLRTALRELAPEPPAELGRIDTARRYAKAIRRRRYAAVTSAVTLVAVAAAGLALRPAAPEVEPTAPPAGVFPNWPRRGDITDLAVTDAAVGAWRNAVGDVVATANVRILYAGGEPAVVVFHAVAPVGGERLVVVRHTERGYTVHSDAPAPLRNEPITALLDVPLPQPRGRAGRCEQPGRTDARLLVLGPPGLRAAGWKQDRTRPESCGLSFPPYDPLPVSDGAALTPVRVAKFGELRFQLQQADGRSSTAPPTVEPGIHDSYGGVGIMTSMLDGRLPWDTRSDRTRSSELAQWVSVNTDEAGCDPYADFSLRDGTPVAFCLTADGERVVLWAEDGRRVLKRYLDEPAGATPQAFAAIVDGHTGRWLVVVAPPGTRGGLLAEPGGRGLTLPMTQGIAAVPLGDDEPDGDARVRLPTLGEIPIHDRTGTPHRS